MDDGLIRISNVDNPHFVYFNEGFVAVLRAFYDSAMSHIRSVTFESLHRHVATIVESIQMQQCAGVHSDLITKRVQVGYVDDQIEGFQMFHMLPNGMPHIQTLNWDYIYSEDVKILYKFCLETEKHMVTWNAAFMNFTVSSQNAKLQRIVARGYSNPSTIGTQYSTTGARHGLIKA